MRALEVAGLLWAPWESWTLEALCLSNHVTAPQAADTSSGLSKRVTNERTARPSPLGRSRFSQPLFCGPSRYAVARQNFLKCLTFSASFGNSYRHLQNGKHLLGPKEL